MPTIGTHALASDTRIIYVQVNWRPHLYRKKIVMLQDFASKCTTHSRRDIVLGMMCKLPVMDRSFLNHAHT